MPIYEYACTSCGERVEAKQGFDDPPLEQCEICGGKLRKLYSPVGIVFRGSGFYSTDAKKASTTSSRSSESKGSESKSSESTGSGKKGGSSDSGSTSEGSSGSSSSGSGSSNKES